MPPFVSTNLLVNLSIIFILLKSKIKSLSSKNVNQLLMPENVLSEAFSLLKSYFSFSLHTISVKIFPHNFTQQPPLRGARL